MRKTGGQKPNGWNDRRHPLFPKCNEKPVSEENLSDNLFPSKFKLLQAFLRVNQEYEKLRKLRTRKGTGPAGPRELGLLQGIEHAILRREALEDQFAAKGVFATAVYKDGRAIDLLFQGPGQPRWINANLEVRSSFTLNIPLPMRRSNGGRP